MRVDPNIYDSEKMTLLQASLARIWDHYNDRQFGIVAVSINEISVMHRWDNYREIADEIKQEGFRFVPMRGFGFQEDKATGKTFVEKKMALLAINNQEPNDDFKNFIMDLGRKHGRDCVIVHSPTDAEHPKTLTELMPLKSTIGYVRFKNIHYNKMVEFYVRVLGLSTTPYHFERILAGERMSNWLGGWARNSAGEDLTLSGTNEKQLIQILEFLQKGHGHKIRLEEKQWCRVV